jgi:hypothetical protein
LLCLCTFLFAEVTFVAFLPLFAHSIFKIFNLYFWKKHETETRTLTTKNNLAPGTDVMIFNFFATKNRRKNAVLTPNKA